MPGASGFDLLERLERVPLLVFTTAYDEFALRAFEVNACDYLLKPIRPDRLAAALDKMRALWMAQPRRGRAPGLARVGRRLIASFSATAIAAGSSRWERSCLFEAEGNYARVHFGANRPLIRTLAERARVAARSGALLSGEPPAPHQPALRRAHRPRPRRGLHRPAPRRTPGPRVAASGPQAARGPGALADS